ncbi:hypothetical protein JY651_28760 [Pyxidicoccus parkwayensis]|uniref:Uncharacterized protein n=1 Tax=Pyxidicoccus parkwayensis TaxID=2813578 RepID=A0ABX7NPF1_9BACT|nr:hypothetical protein JY651_28760 [Pyxidicoccus parkwaysis]
MPVKVKVDVMALVRLRQRPHEVLRALDMPLHAAVRRALDFSQFLVPRQSAEERTEFRQSGDGPPQPPLADTGFIDGPLYNLTDGISATWTAGYEHPAAGAVHEGFHWGPQIFNPPPQFLKKAFRKTRGATRKDVAQTLARFLAQHFPSR